ncbi:MAG: hypothetical protein EOM90_14270 [Alphaproteobacteria bacterium]|nr:hypothetical protein [Alphaproteobacteria bacterium]
MAIVQNPITGRTRKMFGTAVFSKQFGMNTMRTKPAGVKNPNTIGQSTQRTKFSTIVYLIRQVLPLINSVYGATLKKMSPFNKIVSINVKNAFTGDPPALDHTKVVLCDFEGSSISNVVMTTLPDQVIDLAWDPNTVNPDELAAPLTLILINCTTNKVILFPDAELRSTGSAEINVPADWAGAQTALHVLTFDYSQTVGNGPKGIIKFKAGADAASVIQ